MIFLIKKNIKVTRLIKTRRGEQGIAVFGCPEVKVMSTPKINIGNHQKEEIRTKELKIGQNMLIYNETAIPLSNISRLSVAKAAREKYNPVYFIMMLCGIICLFRKTTGLQVLVGLVLVGLGAWLVYRVFDINNNQEREFLVLNLNSGQNLYLYSRNHAFTIEIIDVIINCINSHNEYRIDMHAETIESCQFGNGNIMLSKI